MLPSRLVSWLAAVATSAVAASLACSIADDAPTATRQIDAGILVATRAATATATVIATPAPAEVATERSPTQSAATATPTPTSTPEPPTAVVLTLIAPTLTPSPTPTATVAPLTGATSTRGGNVVRDELRRMLPDPLTVHETNGFPFYEVYSGLVSISDSLDGRIEPELAAVWSISDGGSRYVFTLRDGLRFSNGAPVTAADVKWSWERALLEEWRTEAAVAALGLIVGATEMLDGEALAMRGLTVVDDVTLQVELTLPAQHFLYLIAHPVASALSQANFENWDVRNWVAYQKAPSGGIATDEVFDELPAGAGPFRITEYVFPDFVSLEPNPFYWRSPPRIESLEVSSFRVHRSSDGRRPPLTKYDTFSARPDTVRDRVDGVDIWLDGVPISIFDPHIADAAPRVAYFALNTSLPPFDDVHLRRALLHSFDRTPPEFYRFADRPAAGLLPPGIDGHRVDSDASGLKPDRGAAERHFAQSRYGGTDGDTVPGVTLLHLGNAVPLLFDLIDYGRRLDDWFGMRLAFASSSAAGQRGTYVPVREFNEALEAGTLQMRFVTETAAYPDPCAILCRIPDLFGPKAQTDETRQLRAMLDAAMVEHDRAARIAMYQAIEAHILDRALVIPAFWGDAKAYELVKPYVSGYKIPAYGGSRYEDVVVDTTHPDYPADR